MVLGILMMYSGGKLIGPPTQYHVGVPRYLLLSPPLLHFGYLHPLLKGEGVLQRCLPPPSHSGYPCPFLLPGQSPYYCGLGGAMVVVQSVCSCCLGLASGPALEVVAMGEKSKKCSVVGRGTLTGGGGEVRQLESPYV